LTNVEIVARRQFGELLTSDKRWCICVAHRRCGKTVACVQKLIKAALECELREPRFAYLAPLYKQAKDVAWSYLKRLTAPLGAVAHESELRVDLPNGARIRLYGADNPDSLRGIYLDGCVLDEYADMRPSLWSEILRPALSDRKGWATFIGTPKGHNGFYEIYEHAKTSKDWLAVMLKASETGLLDYSELMDAKASMTPDHYEQEFECSFEAAIIGAYYAHHIAIAKKEGRIGRVSRDPLMPIRAFWDIGIRDATTIWVAQFVGREVRVLDYYEAVGQPLGAHLEWLRANNYGQAECVLPHDGANLNVVTGIKFEDHVKAAGFRAKTVPNQGKSAALRRVEAARRLFPSIWFDGERCKAGIEALVAYHEKRDEQRNVGLGPEHDWSSHGADAFGLMCVAYEPPREKKRTEQPSYGAGAWMG
jgi:phage terminase large subunit